MDGFSSNSMISEMKRNNFIKIKTSEFAIWGSIEHAFPQMTEEVKIGAKNFIFLFRWLCYHYSLESINQLVNLDIDTVPLTQQRNTQTFGEKWEAHFIILNKYEHS